MTGCVGLRHYRVANDAALYLQIAKFAGVARNFISSYVLLMLSSPLCWPTLKLPRSSSLLKGSKKAAKRTEKERNSITSSVYAGRDGIYSQELEN